MPAPVEKIYVVVPNYRGYIQALQMYAPIVSPLGVTKIQAQQMLLSGLEVHQYNPATKGYTKLTLQSLTTGVTAPVETPVAPPKETKPLKGVTAHKEAPKEETPVEEEAPKAEEPVEETVTKTATEAVEETPAETPAEEVIDEDSIDWSSMTKAQRRAMRAKLNAQKEAQAAAEETPAEETTEE